MFYMIVTEIYNSQRNYIEIVHKIEPSNNDTIHNIIRNIGPVQNSKKCIQISIAYFETILVPLPIFFNKSNLLCIK